jgi:predicted transcriptional regulator
MHKVFQQLQTHFGLQDQDITILEALQDTTLNAEHLSKTTRIPYSRIYTIVNKLVTQGLVHRSKNRPYLYATTDLQHNIMRFMKQKVDNLLQAEEKVLHSMKGSRLDYLHMINSSREYTQNHLRLVTEAKKMIIVSFHGSFPFLLYPKKWEDFVKVRRLIAAMRETITNNDYETMFRIHQTYQDALQEGKEWIVIFEKLAWEQHTTYIKEKLGEEFFKNYLHDLHQQLIKHTIQAYVIDEFMPMEIDMTEDKALISLRHLGTTTGTLIRSKQVIHMYQASVEQKIQRCQLLIPLIEQLNS